MLTKFPPELIKRLIDHCLDTGDTFGRVDKDVAISNQRRLVRLSLVCKTLANHCLPLLYQDTILCHPSAILDDGAKFPQTKRLRLGHRRPSCSNVYFILICDRWGKSIWTQLAYKSSPNDPKCQTRVTAHEEATLCLAAARGLSEHLRDNKGGAQALPHLERVVMGDLEELWWYQLVQAHPSRNAIAINDSRDALAQYFVQLETVQHYCQSELFGPFALPCKPMRMSSPPKIVTYHMPNNFFADFIGDEPLLPPVVNGAINRFFWPLPVPIFFLPDDRRNRVKEGGELTWGDCAARGKDEVPDRSDTVIEVYHYIERIAVDSSDEATRMGLLWPPQDPSEPLTRLPLNPLQTWLDNQRQPEHPRLYLKTLDEAEPCTACDFDFRAAGYDSPQRALVAEDYSFRVFF